MIRALIGFFSRITVRLLTFNVLLVFLPVAALLYLDTYERQLLRSLEHALVQQGRILASALSGNSPLQAEKAQRILRGLEQRHEARLRVVDAGGRLLADSSRLDAGADRPSATEQGGEEQDHAAASRPAGQRPLYRLATLPVQMYRRLLGPPAPPLESAEYYVGADRLLGPEIRDALRGRYGAATRISTGGQRSVTLYSAIPVRSGQSVVGAVLISQSTYRILQDLYELRLEIFTVFLLSLAVAVALSLLSSITIAAPVRRLRRQAQQILDHRGRLRGHMRFNRRRDEIGDLSRSLEEMTRKLEGHIQFVESFASDLSHELRNPLASIRSAAEMCAQAPDAGQRRRLMTLVQKEVARMLHLLGAVREVSLLDARLQEEERSSVEVGGVLGQVVEARRLRAAFSQRVEIVQGDALSVSMAPARLVQVLENLLDNALSFACTQVRIELYRDKDLAVILFEDDGPGIPQAHRQRIFDRFFSYRCEAIPAGSDDSEAHLGLGLAIVKAIVEGYGGTVEAGGGGVAGNRLEGACLAVRLPAAGRNVFLQKWATNSV
jgi:two-component system sensor histidine kinase ChvG